MSTDTRGGLPVAAEQIELSITGMTCASCAARIERRLNKLDGVTATVNYATEKAKVSYPAGLDTTTLVDEVAAAGYSAKVPQPAGPATENADQVAEADPTQSLRTRLITSVVLSVPVIAMAMIPALQFTYWQWISLALAGPVIVWGALPFHRA
ncbi:MAG: cation transporter, partial [Actinomycetota bacterium]|nr:cation transporter [Actinomycetota bacterium]